MKQTTNILGWLLIAFYLFITLGFVNKKHDMIPCNKINVVILDSANNRFVDRNDVVSVFEREQKEILGYPVTSINTKDLEVLLNSHWSIKNAEVYTQIDGSLFVEVVQRKPLIRVIDRNRNSYYIDEDGIVMPLSDKYASHILIANGNIEPLERSVYENVKIVVTGDTAEAHKILGNLYNLAEYIHQDPFWSAQIVQVYVNSNYEFELIPRVGAHVILLGDISDFRKKFDKLKTLYINGFNNVGWNDYNKINLKYKNQIICTKK